MSVHRFYQRVTGQRRRRLKQLRRLRWLAKFARLRARIDHYVDTLPPGDERRFWLREQLRFGFLCTTLGVPRDSGAASL